MERSEGHGDALQFVPLLKGSDAVRKRVRAGLLSPYKLALFGQDLVLANLAFWTALWLTGLSALVVGDSRQHIPVLICSFMVMVFFPTYHLYSYHHIFLKKTHLINLLKSFCWCLLTIGSFLFLYSYPDLLEGGAAVPMVVLGAIMVLLLSRFYWNYLLHFLKSFGLCFIALGVMDMLFPDENPIVMQHWHVVPIGLSLAVGLILGSRLLLVHLVFGNWMRRHFRQQVAIIGSGEEAKRIAGYILEHNAPIWIAGFLSSEENIDLGLPAPKGLLGELRDLPLIVRREKIDEVIVTDEDIDRRTLISLLDYCTSEHLTVWFPPELMPIIDMKLYVDTFFGLPMIRLCSQKNISFFNKVKHAFDALITLPVALILLPFGLVIAAAVKGTSPGPVFYRARAVGRDGKRFRMYKFRSMKVNEHSEIHMEFVTRLIRGEIRPETNGNGPLKVAEDPRITRVGKLLRKYSLDELPQLFNVLKADMSLVGPRPCLPYEYEIYKDWHKKRLSIRPGITGIWQVAGRSAVSFEDMVILDLYYIYNRDLGMDLNILYETIFAVLQKRGAY